MNFLGRAFSENGEPSSSRLVGAVAMLVVLTGWLCVAIHNWALPDGAVSAGAAGLGTAPYTVSQVTGIWKKKDSADPK